MAQSLSVLHEEDADSNSTINSSSHRKIQVSHISLSSIKPEPDSAAPTAEESQWWLNYRQWLYAIGIFETIMMLYKTIFSTVLFVKEKEMRPPNELNKGDIETVRRIYMVAAACTLLTAVLLAMMTGFIVAALQFKNEMKKRGFLEFWSYGSYVLLVVDCYFIQSFIVKEILETQVTNTSSVNAAVIIDLVVTLIDVVFRIGALYVTKQLVKGLTSKMYGLKGYH